MTVEAWVTVRSRGAPTDLTEAVTSAARSTHSRSASTALQLAEAAGALLPRVVRSGCDDRRGAFDLLTLDALITYAMQAAATSAEDCERSAAAVLRELGRAAESLSAARGR